MKKKSPKQILNSLKKIIDSGWCRGQSSKWVRGKEHFCLSGAIREVNRDLLTYPIRAPLYFKIEQRVELDRARDALTQQADRSGFQGIISFNDAQKDKRQVIAMINRAIKSLP